MNQLKQLNTFERNVTEMEAERWGLGQVCKFRSDGHGGGARQETMEAVAIAGLLRPSFLRRHTAGEFRNILHISFCSEERLINLENEIHCDAAQASRYHRLH